VSIEAMVWALEKQGLEPVDKLTLLGIANHADRYGENAWPSIRTLALYAGRSEMTVRRSLRRLSDLGLIRVDVQGGGSTRHGGYRPNLYTLRMRGHTDDTPPVERGSTDDRSGGTSTIPEGSHDYGRRTVPEPSKNRPCASEGFEEWWKAYPRRIGRRAAQTAFQRALRGSDAPTVDTLIAGARKLAAEGRETRFVPYPTTWLNQGRWDDDPEVVVEPIEPEKPFCGECVDGWQLRVRDGVETLFPCRCRL